MPVNPIKLAQPAGKIAAALAAAAPDDELRAKKSNGVMVLYARPRAKGVQRVMQDLFSNRKEKLGNAHALLQQRFSHLPEGTRDAALKSCRWHAPAAGNYQKGFQAIVDTDMPDRFESFMSEPAFTSFMPGFREFADKRQLGDEFDFVLNLNGLAGLEPKAAQKLAASVMASMAAETPAFNVKGNTIEAAAGKFGVKDKKQMRAMTEKQWLARMDGKTGPELSAVLSSFQQEVANDLHKNCYLQFVQAGKKS
ncbi:hypothetical protein [Lacisediminimonas sp.]|uniref:hypothetical protein n=1 Tax=Lacisediminimonas sp. TaxID=3060582 RepID=UPI002725655D|nr:hypothetical protein [Lacisediminimonas sp.]MDO8299055.1 hypothetical protein [Lacisediminimonas sp.]